MDEYKQLRESLNRAPNIRQPEQNHAPQHPQAAAIAPESHVHAAQQTAILEQPHKDKPAHEDHHQDHQDTESRVKGDFSNHITIKRKGTL